MVPVAASSPNTHPLPTTKKNYRVDRSRSSSSSTSSDERDHNLSMVNRNAQPQQIFSMDAESANHSAFSANDTAFSKVYGNDWILLAEEFTKKPTNVGCCDYSQLFYINIIYAIYSVYLFMYYSLINPYWLYYLNPNVHVNKCVM